MTKMKHKYWWAESLPVQKSQMQNFCNKIEHYEATLNLTTGQIVAIQKVCEDAIAAINYVEGCKTSMQGATAFRNDVLNGKSNSEPVPPPPVFPQNAPANPGRGLFKKFHDFRDMIVRQPGYTLSIGEDLGIIGSQVTPQPDENVQPRITAVSKANYTIEIKASLQNMDALRVEYATGSGSFQQVGLFTSKPGSIHITPQTPGQPEKGRVRAIFIKKSQEVGYYSDIVPVTIF